MSTVEDDIELRDLVAQTLEKNGCLSKLRAELRASIFLALEEDIKLSKQQPLQNIRIQSYLETPEGRAMFCLVREFLEFFNLKFTISVYEPESYLNTIYHYEGRQKIIKDLGLENVEEPTIPLLQHLLKIAQTKSKVLDINLNLDNNINSSFKDESLNVDSSYKKTEPDCISFHNNTNSCSYSKHQNVIGQNNENLIHNLKNSVENTTNIQKNSNKKYNIESNRNSEKGLSEEDVYKNIISLAEDSECLVHTGTNLEAVKVDLNETFEVNNPSVDMTNLKKVSIETNLTSQNKAILRCIREDDTYEDTSSIPEDNEISSLSDKSFKFVEMTVNTIPLVELSDSKINNTETSINSELNNSELSVQKPNTSSYLLSDLSQTSTNKSRLNSEILPSMYNKDFKNNSSVKELDKIFDMEVDYEEDFMCSSNELSLSRSHLRSEKAKNGLVFESNNCASEVCVNVDTKELSNKVKSDKKPISNASQKNCSDFLKNGSSVIEHSLSD